ncbi:MAG TPA: ROK family protein [Nitrolancea sp.]|nr:ROK family protein [Nitrolancea sp.]
MEQARLPGSWSTLLTADKYVCGIEIGGRGQRVVVAGGNGRIVGQARSIDSMAPASGVVETVKDLIDQACNSAHVAPEDIVRVGIAFGGPVDVDRGLTLLSHRVSGFENFPLVNLIEEHLGVPTVIDNSARASALGEIVYGAARGSSDVVYVHLGTGVGGGIIVDGRLLHGASSTAGEFGHMVVSVGGPICSCGKPGHLEAYAAAPAIVSRFRERLEAQSTTDFTSDRWLNPKSITVRSIFDAAKQGDAAARDVVVETVQVLGLAIANLITTLNPAAVIVGGTVADVGSLLMDPLSARVRQYSFPSAARRVRLTASQLGSDTTVLGAVALALESLRR